MLTPLTPSQLAEREQVSPQAIHYRITQTDKYHYLPIAEYRKNNKKGYVLKHIHYDDLADFFSKNEKAWSHLISLVQWGNGATDAA